MNLMRARWLILLMAILCYGCCPNHSADPSSPLLTRDDEFRIKKAILKDLFDEQAAKSTVETTAFSAYVLNDAMGNDLVAAFKDHVPPVSNTISVSTDTGPALDRATGKPVKLFRITIRSFTSDSASGEIVHAGAGWTRATLDGEWFAYTLQRVKGNWIIKKRTVAGVC